MTNIPHAFPTVQPSRQVNPNVWLIIDCRHCTGMRETFNTKGWHGIFDRYIIPAKALGYGPFVFRFPGLPTDPNVDIARYRTEDSFCGDSYNDLRRLCGLHRIKAHMYVRPSVFFGYTDFVRNDMRRDLGGGEIIIDEGGGLSVTKWAAAQCRDSLYAWVEPVPDAHDAYAIASPFVVVQDLWAKETAFGKWPENWAPRNKLRIADSCMWMGKLSESSSTDVLGRIHHLAAYATREGFGTIAFGADLAVDYGIRREQVARVVVGAKS